MKAQEGLAGSFPVVAVVIWRRGRIALLERSAKVSHDAGLWHCVTGYLESDTLPEQQALSEVFEETGLVVADLQRFEKGPTLELLGTSGTLWTVHTFSGETKRKKLRLNWEHDKYRWASPRTVPGFDQVSWLSDVVRALEAAGSYG